MADDSQQWRHITALLPVGTAMEIAAQAAVRQWIKDKYEGATFSVVAPPLFDGFWKKDGTWHYDKHSMMLLDIPLSETTLDATVSELNQEISKYYNENSAGQIAIWITVNDLIIPKPISA